MTKPNYLDKPKRERIALAGEWKQRHLPQKAEIDKDQIPLPLGKTAVSFVSPEFYYNDCGYVNKEVNVDDCNHFLKYGCPDCGSINVIAYDAWE